MNDQTLLPFSPKQALRYGWATTQANLRPLVTLGVIGFLLAVFNHELTGHREGLGSLLALLVQVMQAVVAMQFIRASLTLYDEKPLDLTPRTELLSDLFSYLLTSIVYGVIVGVGLVLLIVPGVIWGLKYGYATFLVVDRKLDPLAALRESARVTDGAKRQLLILGLLLFGVNLAGAMALGIGLLVTIPTTFLAAVYALRHLQQRAPVQASTAEAASMSLTPSQ